MDVNELLGAISWLWFEGAHCAVLEKREAILSKEMHELHAQHAIDKAVYAAEGRSLRRMSLTLDTLEDAARAIDKTVQQAMPTLLEKERTYAAQLQEMRSIACCMIVPEQVLDAMKEVRSALQGYKESKQALLNAIQLQNGE